MEKRSSYISVLAGLLVFSQVFQIITAAELGEVCTETEECKDGASGDLSICGPQGTCICNGNSVPNSENSKCFEIVDTIGGLCEIKEQCSEGPLGNLSYCDPLFGQGCQCTLITSIPNLAKTKCLPVRATIGAPCEEDSQCRNGIPGFHSLCKKEKENSEDGTCQCYDYSVAPPGQHTCFIIRDKIGDQCSAHIQCTTKMGNLSECRAFKCQCKENDAIENSDKTKCLKAEVPIRQPCEETAQCVGFPNSVCSTSKRCDCKVDFVPSSPLDDCLPIVNKLGENCKESQQCSSGIPGNLSACIENKCGCVANATSGGDEHICRKSAIFVGDPCEIHAQCTVNLGHSFCQGNSCVCLSDAVESRNETKCLLKAYLEEECTEDKQCNHVKHSVCVLDDGNVKTCQCDSRYTVNPSSGEGREAKCMKLAELIGEPCEQHETQCRELDGAVCNETEKLCVCNPEKDVASEEKNICLPKRENLGENCEENQQCLVDHSWCQLLDGDSAETCNCQRNFTKWNNECLKVAVNYNETCREDIQCAYVGVKNEVPCHDGRCQCVPPTGFHNKLCIHKAKLNESCNNNDECHFGVNNLARCLRKPESEEKWCQCEPNTKVGEDGFCYIPKAVGGSCENDIECKVGILGPVYCDPKEGICTCENGYKADTGGIRCSGGHSIINNFNLIGSLIGVLVLIILK